MSTKAKRPKKTTADAVTSREKTARHDTYCTPCRVWYAQEKKACPNCGRALLMG